MVSFLLYTVYDGYYSIKVGFNMYQTETQLIVRYAETDQMGVVHHSHYPVWFEAGRTDFIKKAGLPYSIIEEKGYMLPLIELRCNYKRFSRYEDVITIKTRIKEYSPLRLTFYYEVYRNEEAGLVASGETYHVWTDRQLKPVNLKKRAPEVFSIICQCYEVDDDTECNS